MRAVTGTFPTRSEAQHAFDTARSIGIDADRITLLTPERMQQQLESTPVVAAEQPGMGKAIGAVVGAAAGMAGGGALVAAAVPAVGVTAAVGVLGAAILAAAGATIGAAAGGKVEGATTEGLPEDEIFVYEDALRKGKSVVVALAENDHDAAGLRELLKAEGAEAVDAAREQWWIGLRSAEKEHYLTPGRHFDKDEKFYRLGFEAALHARNRCKEFDQVHSEMESTLADVQRQYPNSKVDEAFTAGYQRGRSYYQHLCEESKAA